MVYNQYGAQQGAGSSQPHNGGQQYQTQSESVLSRFCIASCRRIYRAPFSVLGRTLLVHLYLSFLLCLQMLLLFLASPSGLLSSNLQVAK